MRKDGGSRTILSAGAPIWCFRPRSYSVSIIRNPNSKITAFKEGTKNCIYLRATPPFDVGRYFFISSISFSIHHTCPCPMEFLTCLQIKAKIGEEQTTPSRLQMVKVYFTQKSIVLTYLLEVCFRFSKLLTSVLYINEINTG